MDDEKQSLVQEWTKTLKLYSKIICSCPEAISDSSIPPLAEVVVVCFLDTQGCLHMLMRLWWGPEPHGICLLTMPTQVETCLVAEEMNFKRRGLLSIRSLIYSLAKLIGLVLVSLALSFKNLRFNGHHRTPGNPHLLWQPSGGLLWWLFQTSPKVLNKC